MAELATAYVTLIPSLKGAQKTITQQLSGVNVESAGTSLGNTLLKGAKGGLTGIAKGLGTVAKVGVGSMAAIGTAVGGLAVGGGISRALKLDNAKNSFRTMGIDVDKAMKSCNDSVKGTAFGLDAAATVAASLGVSGVKAGNEMTKSLKAVAGMASLGGVEMERVGLVFGKVAAQGKLQGDELMQLSEMGVPALQMLSKHLGKSTSDVRDMVKDGEVDFQTFSDAMYAAFGTAAQGANNTFQGAMSNVNAALSRVGAKFASPALDGLRKVFVALIPAIDAFSAALDPAVKVFEGFVSSASKGAISVIEAFTKTLKNGGSIADAFGAAFGKLSGYAKQWAVDIGNAFNNSPVGQWVTKLQAAFLSAETPMEGFKNVLGEVKAKIGELVSGTNVTGFVDGLKSKFAELPQPVQDVVRAIADFGKGIASALSGINVGGTVALAGFVAILAKFGAPLTSVVTKLGSFGSAAVGAFSKIGGISGIVGTIGMKLNTLGSAVTLCGGGLRGFATVAGSVVKTALMGMVSPVGLVVAGIAALVAAFAYMMVTNEGFRNSVMSIVTSIGASLLPTLTLIGTTLSNVASTVLPMVTSMVSMLVPVLAQVVMVVLQIVAAVMPIVTTLVSTLMPVLQVIITTVMTVVTALVSALVPVLTVILGAIQALMPVVQMIVTIVTSVITALASLLVPVIQIISSAILTILPIITQIITVITQVVQTIVAFLVPIITQVATFIQTIIPVVIMAVTNGFTLIQSIIQAVMPVIQTVITTVWNVIQTVITTVMSVIQGIITVVLGVIQGYWRAVWSGIQAVASAVWSGIQGVISGAISAVSSIISSVLSAISSIWNSCWSGISSFVSSIWSQVTSRVSSGVSSMISTISSIPGKVMSFFADAGSWLINAGKSIIDGLINGIKDKMGGLGSALGGIGDFIVSHKGPPSYDKVMLVPAGQLIMGSLVKGLGSGMPQLQRVLADASGMMEGFATEISPFEDVNASVRTWGKAEIQARNDGVVSEILDRLDNYLPGLANQKLVLDTGTVAGEMAPYIDRNLGIKNTRRSKGL